MPRCRPPTADGCEAYGACDPQLRESNARARRPPAAYDAPRARDLRRERLGCPGGATCRPVETECEVRSRWLRFAARGHMIETAKQLTATAYQTRLRGRNANLRHQCNLGEFMTEHVVQEHGLGVGRLHFGELNSQSLEFGAGGGFTFHVHASARWLGLDARFAIQHAALAATRTQRVEADVTGDAGRPSSQTAGPRVRAARERHYDLLESRLHEIVVVDLPPTKHAVQGMIDH